jgi:hypothetical protein
MYMYMYVRMYVERLGAQQIVQEMHGLWTMFDELVQQHGMYQVCVRVFSMCMCHLCMYECIYVCKHTDTYMHSYR